MNPKYYISIRNKYVHNERIFGGLLFTSNEIFLGETFSKSIALTFSLILAPLAVFEDL